MRIFIKNAIIFALPLLVIVVIVFWVDPYCLFSKPLYNDLKFNIGYSYDQGRRYKIFTYWNEPTDKIILGASEINVINERNIPETGWHSLSYGGAPLQESLQMYWEASKRNKLSKVIIAPEFIKYYNAISSGNGDPYYASFNWNTSQSKKTFDIYNNKLNYFTDKYTLKATYSYLISCVSNSEVKSVPRATKEQFWDSQLDYAHSIYDHNIVIQDKVNEVKVLFEKIKKDADDKGVEITIVLPVQHIDLLKIEYQERTFEIYKDYLKTLVELFGKVYYYAYTPNISENPEFFSDPFHFTKADFYLNKLWDGNHDNSITTNKVDSVLESARNKVLEYE